MIENVTNRLGPVMRHTHPEHIQAVALSGALKENNPEAFIRKFRNQRQQFLSIGIKAAMHNKCFN